MRTTTGIALLALALLAAPGCGDAGESQLLEAVRERMAPEADDSPLADIDPDDAALLASLDTGDQGAADAAAAGAGEAVLIESGEFSSLDGESAQPAEEPIYRFVDASGTPRMVRGRHNVPERYRATATSLSRSSMPVINRYETQEVAERRVVSYEAPYNPNKSRVLLYSAEWCGACRKAKAFLDQEGVAYDLLDIDRDPRAKEEVRRVLGSVRIPLLDIDGTYVAGFSPSEIRKALGKSG